MKMNPKVNYQRGPNTRTAAYIGQRIRRGTPSECIASSSIRCATADGMHRRTQNQSCKIAAGVYGPDGGKRNQNGRGTDAPSDSNPVGTV